MPRNRAGRLAYALLIAVLLLVIGRNVYRRALNNRLAVAVREHNHDAVRKCLDWGADANVRVYPVKPMTIEKPALEWALDSYSSLTPDREEIACLLLQHGANVRGERKVNYLTNACQCGSVRVERCLLEHGADPNPPGASYNTPMYVAIEYRLVPQSNTITKVPAPTPEKLSEAQRLQREAESKRRLEVSREMARLLRQHGAAMSLAQMVRVEDMETLRTKLDAGTPVDERELLPTISTTGKTSMRKGPTALTEAAQSGRVNVVRLLLDRGANVNAFMSDYPYTPLNGAIIGKHLEIARLLLKQGADVNPHIDTPIPAYFTPLAISCRDLPPLVPELLQYGADVKMAGGYALGAAISSKHPDLVTLLLNHGASIQDKAGYTALAAAIQDQPDLVPLLLKHGASVRGKAGHAVLDAAIQYQPGLVPQLLAQGAEAREAPNAEAGLIWQAVRYDRKNLIVPLVRAGANVNVHQWVSGGGMGNAQKIYDTPLLEAIQRGLDTVDLLLKHGADPNLQNAQGYTPLIIAAQVGNTSATRLLLAHKVRVDDEGKMRHTPLHYARRHKHPDVAALLQQAGGQEK